MIVETQKLHDEIASLRQQLVESESTRKLHEAGLAFALEHLAEAQERMKWQPIETAPKGKNEILIFFEPGHCDVCCWNTIENDWVNSSSHVPAGFATHWMPLPPAPEADHAG